MSELGQICNGKMRLMIVWGFQTFAANLVLFSMSWVNGWKSEAYTLRLDFCSQFVARFIARGACHHPTHHCWPADKTYFHHHRRRRRCRLRRRQIIFPLLHWLHMKSFSPFLPHHLLKYVSSHVKGLLHWFQLKVVSTWFAILTVQP